MGRPEFPVKEARATTISDSTNIAEELECEVECNIQAPRAMAAVLNGDLPPPGPWESKYVLVQVKSENESSYTSAGDRKNSLKSFLGCWASRKAYAANEQPLVVYELSF